jgi:hypothetical protein
MGFKLKPPVQEKTATLTVTLPAAHHARLVAVGEKHNLPPEEVLRQFVAWAVETGNIGSARTRKPSKKAATKPE